MRSKLHEVVLPVLITVLVARIRHVVLGEELVVGMVLLPLLLLPLLRLFGLFLAPLELSILVFLAKLLETILLFLLQVGLLLHLCLVEAVDDGVLALRNEDPLDLAVILETNLANLHAAILLQVRPGGVDDGDVVLLVALYGVGLGQLRQVHDQGLGQRVPFLACTHSEVDVRTGQFIDVEPNILLPAKLDQILILKLVLADVDEARRLDDIGLEVVNHFRVLLQPALCCAHKPRQMNGGGDEQE